MHNRHAAQTLAWSVLVTGVVAGVAGPAERFIFGAAVRRCGWVLRLRGGRGETLDVMMEDEESLDLDTFLDVSEMHTSLHEDPFSSPGLDLSNLIQEPCMASPCAADDSHTVSCASGQSTIASTPQDDTAVCAISPFPFAASAEAGNATIAEAGDIGITKTRKGLAYDLSTVDDKLKKRPIKNRLSAERSRQRRLGALQSLQAENAELRAENEAMAAKMKRMEELMAAHGLSLP